MNNLKLWWASLKHRFTCAWMVLTHGEYVVHVLEKTGKVKTRSKASLPFMQHVSPKLARTNKVQDLKASGKHTTSQNRYN